jgi:hypothetical protein
MKNQGLILLLLGAGAFFLISAKRKPAGRVFVPEPETITEQQFKKPSLLQKVSKVVQKVAPVVKEVRLTAKQKKAAKKTAAALSKRSILRGVGQFPDVC